MIHRNKFLKYYLCSMAEEGEDGGAGGSGDSGSGDSGDDGSVPDGESTDGVDEGSDEAIKGAWPDDWQSRLAKGDEKLVKRFGRFQSPEALAQSYLALERKLSSGEMLPKLDDKADEKEIAEYRKALGIPDKPEKYDLKLESGRVVGEEDKPFVDAYLAKAHEANMTPAQVKASVDAYLENREQAIQARADLDEQEREETLNELSEEWGSNMKPYKNRISNLLSKIPESVREDFMSARFPDGRAVFNHPDVLRGLVAIDLELDPAGTTTAGHGDPMKGVEQEIDELEGFMRKNRAEYNKDEKKQARLRELYGIRETLQQRQKAS